MGLTLGLSRLLEAGDMRLVPADTYGKCNFENDNLCEAWRVFLDSCKSTLSEKKPVRAAVDSPIGWSRLCERALAETKPQSNRDAHGNFKKYFDAWQIEQKGKNGFVTGYYEPEVEASAHFSIDFPVPLLARPADPVSPAPADEEKHIGQGITATREAGQDRHVRYPDRAMIEKHGLGSQARPIVWLRDHTEAFMIHVQGSARACLGDGKIMRLTYDGRNGLPYTSIGKHLIDRKLIPAEGISLEQLKMWLRGDIVRGLSVMHQNSSFIFFKSDLDGGQMDGPVGGASIRLTPLRSIAIDRSLWPYGLPFWIEAEIPWTGHKATPFAQLMIAQDTGSAILGAARADIFFGSGRFAGERAGDIRHNARFTVLLPKDECV